MRRLVGSEVAKLRTTRVATGLLVTTLVLVVVSVSGAISTGDRAQGDLALEASKGLRLVIRAANQGSLLVLLLGVLAIAGEHRHATMTHTLLVVPDRRRLVAAKLAAYALAGAAFGALASLATLAVALPWLAAKGIEASVLSADVGLVLVGVVATGALFGVLGVGVGGAVRNQVTAVAVTLVWVLVVEGLVGALLPDVGRWLPGGAADALSRSTEDDLLPMWQGALVLAGYAAGLATLGTGLVMRSDVT